MTADVVAEATPGALPRSQSETQRVAEQPTQVSAEAIEITSNAVALDDASLDSTEADAEDAATRSVPRWPSYLLALAATLWMVKLAQPFLVPVVVAILIFYALVLPVDALERMRVPRALGAALVVLALVAATTLT